MIDFIILSFLWLFWDVSFLYLQKILILTENILLHDSHDQTINKCNRKDKKQHPKLGFLIIHSTKAVLHTN